MAEDITAVSVGEFQSLIELLVSSEALQTAFIISIVGIIGLVVAYRRFSKIIKTKKFHYKRPHASKFLRTGLLPVFAIILISSINVYVYSTGLFDPSSDLNENTSELFSKILDTLNILVVGYTISQIIPIILTKKEKSKLEYDDYVAWQEKQGFSDDDEISLSKSLNELPPRTVQKT